MPRLSRILRYIEDDSEDRSVGRYSCWLAPGILEINDWNSLLVEACFETCPAVDLRIINLLLWRGADVNCRVVLCADKDGEPVYRADAARSDGQTPLYACTVSGNQSVAQFLLVHGAKVNDLIIQFTDDDPTRVISCLSTAIQREDHEMVELLLDYGAGIQEPLDLAFETVELADIRLLRLLMDAGQDMQVISRAGHSLMDYSLQEISIYEKVATCQLTDFSNREEWMPEFHCRMAMIEFLVSVGCAGPTVAALRFAVEHNAYMSLVHTYRLCIDSSIKITWPTDLTHPPLTSLFTVLSDDDDEEIPKTYSVAYLENCQSHINLLKNLIRRSRYCGANSAVMLRFLSSLVMSTDCPPQATGLTDRVEMPKLVELCLGAVRASLGRTGHIVESELQLPLPRPYKRKISLADLDDADRAKPPANKVFRSWLNDAIT